MEPLKNRPEADCWFDDLEIDADPARQQETLDHIRASYQDTNGADLLTDQEFESLVTMLREDAWNARSIYVATVRARASEEYQAHQLAVIDPLTKAYNRNGLDRWIKNTYGIGGPDEFRSTPERRQQPPTMSKIYVDLTNFKAINDCLGHNIGDAVLIQAVDELNSILRAADQPVVVREGGDELAVFFAGQSAEEAQAVQQRIHISQLRKLQASYLAWQRIHEIKASQPTLPPVTIRKERYPYPGDEDRVQEMSALFIGEERITGLASLAVLATGYAQGTLRTTEDLKAINHLAEARMTVLKIQYHTLMGGAYRSASKQ